MTKRPVYCWNWSGHRDSYS